MNEDKTVDLEAMLNKLSIRVYTYILTPYYQSTRLSSYPKNFLGDFKGFLQTNGYNGYNSVSSAIRVYSLAHIRRYFHNIIVDLDEKALKNSRAAIGFNYCEQIYKLEKELRVMKITMMLDLK